MAREIFEIIFDADGSKASSAFAQVGSTAKKELGDAEKSAGGFLDKLTNDSPKASGALDKIAASSQGFVNNIVRDLPTAGAEFDGLAASGDVAAGAFSRLGTDGAKGLGEAKAAGKALNDEIKTGSKGATTALKDLGSSAEDVGSKFSKALPGIGGQLQSLGAKASGTADIMGSSLAAAAVVGGAAIGAFVGKSVLDFQNLAQETLHFQQVAGGSAEEASRWVQTADDFGVSTDQLASAMGKLEQNIGTSPAKIEALGVQIAHTKEGAVDMPQTLFNIIDAYNATEDPTKRAALAQQAFGKQWQGLVKLLDAGSDSVRSDFKSISDAQLFSQGDLQASEDFRLALDDLGDQLQGLEVTIGKAVVPQLTEMAHWLGVVGDAAAKAGGNSGIGAVASGFLDAADPIHRVQSAWSDVVADTTKIETVTPHIVSFKDATSEVAVEAQNTAEYTKAMQKTFQDIDKDAQDATKSFQDHGAALDAVRQQYGDFGAIAISNSHLSTDALKEMASQASSFRDGMFNAFHGATGPLDEFSGKSKVTADQFIKSLKDQKTAADNWARDLQTAADAGVNEGFLEKLAEAGPKAAPILAGLLDAVKRGDVDKINQLQQDTDTALTTGANAVLNHKPEWSAAGTAVGDATKQGATSALNGLGAAVGGSVTDAATALKYSALPAWVDAGSELGQAFIAAAARNIANYHPATTANQGGGKDFRVQAAGGVMSPGRATLVGEKGPEMVVPGIYPKTVIPNKVLSQLGGSGVNATVNINAPVYGVDDLQGAIYGALDQVRRRAMVGVR